MRWDSMILRLCRQYTDHLFWMRRLLIIQVETFRFLPFNCSRCSYRDTYLSLVLWNTKWPFVLEFESCNGSSVFDLLISQQLRIWYLEASNSNFHSSFILSSAVMENYKNLPPSLYGLTPSQMDMFMTEDNPVRRQSGSVTEVLSS